MALVKLYEIVGCDELGPARFCSFLLCQNLLILKQLPIVGIIHCSNVISRSAKKIKLMLLALQVHFMADLKPNR